MFLTAEFFISLNPGQLKTKAGFTHANFAGRCLNFSKQTQAKNRLNAMTSPILKNRWTVYRFWPDFCLDFAWILLEILKILSLLTKSCKSDLSTRYSAFLPQTNLLVYNAGCSKSFRYIISLIRICSEESIFTPLAETNESSLSEFRSNINIFLNF